MTEWEEEKYELPELVHKHALIQAEQAGCRPADGKALAYMAQHVEYAMNGRFNVPRQHIRIAQVMLAKNIGVSDRQVRYSMQRLREAALIVDTEYGTRNRKHLYKVTMDWSFSRILSKRFAEEVVAAPAGPQPKPKKEVYKPRKSGTVLPNRRPDSFCTVRECARPLPINVGVAVKFQDEFRTFCPSHRKLGETLSGHGWPEDNDINTAAEAEAWLHRSTMRLLQGGQATSP